MGNDHHYPLSRGHGLMPDNAVLLCGSCNSFKKDKLPVDFYSSIELERVNYLLAMATVSLLVQG